MRKTKQKNGGLPGFCIYSVSESGRRQATTKVAQASSPALITQRRCEYVQTYKRVGAGLPALCVMVGSKPAHYPFYNLFAVRGQVWNLPLRQISRGERITGYRARFSRN